MRSSHDEDALWLKAKLFLNHAMDADEPRAFDERALWASLALELLAKAALARVSPLLIASPTEDGTNLLIASGLVEGEGRFTSVKAHTLYSRCARAFRPFSERDAQQITWARNEYLHGGAASFSAIPPDAWWPSFWAQAIILTNAQDKSLQELVGDDRVASVEGYLAQNKKNIEHRFEMLVARARQRLAQVEAGNVSARIAKEWATPADLKASLSYSEDTTCPACGELGDLEGEDVESSEMHYDRISYDDYEAWVDLTVSADYFSCPNCRLVLDGYELINAAGLPRTISATGDPSDYIDDDYGND